MEYREAGYRADLAVYNVDGGSYRRISDVPDGVFLEGRQVAGGMMLAHRYEKEVSRFARRAEDSSLVRGSSARSGRGARLFRSWSNAQSQSPRSGSPSFGAGLRSNFVVVQQGRDAA